MKIQTLLLASLLLTACGTTPAAPVAMKAATGDAQAKGIFNQPVVLERQLTEIMRDYDHNGNDRIEMNRPPASWWPPYVAPDERVRKETVRSTERDNAGNVVRYVYRTYTYARPDLFAAADADHDDVVTRQELLATLGSFDADGDGLLTRRGLWGWITQKERGEYDKFQLKYAERQIDVRVDYVDYRNRIAAQELEAQATMVDKASEDEAATVAAQQAQTAR